MPTLEEIYKRNSDYAKRAIDRATKEQWKTDPVSMLGLHEQMDDMSAEHENLLALLERALPYVHDMVGISSEARFLEVEIKSALQDKLEKDNERT